MGVALRSVLGVVSICGVVGHEEANHGRDVLHFQGMGGYSQEEVSPVVISVLMD